MNVKSLQRTVRFINKPVLDLTSDMNLNVVSAAYRWKCLVEYHLLGVGTIASRS